MDKVLKDPKIKVNMCAKCSEFEINELYSRIPAVQIRLCWPLEPQAGAVRQGHKRRGLNQLSHGCPLQQRPQDSGTRKQSYYDRTKISQTSLLENFKGNPNPRSHLVPDRTAVLNIAIPLNCIYFLWRKKVKKEVPCRKVAYTLLMLLHISDVTHCTLGKRALFNLMNVAICKRVVRGVPG
jgi:hypothetical protein